MKTGLIRILKGKATSIFNYKKQCISFFSTLAKKLFKAMTLIKFIFVDGCILHRVCWDMSVYNMPSRMNKTQGILNDQHDMQV